MLTDSNQANIEYPITKNTLLNSDNDDLHFIDSDNLFSMLPYQNQKCKPELNYYDKLSKFKQNAKKNFSIIHLKVNSLFNNIQELSEILNMDFDVISINETKFDDSIPISRYHHNNYNTIRLDRNGNGGGLLVFIKNCYTILEQKTFSSFEIITFNIKIKNKIFNFIAAYKSPNVSNTNFIELLQNILFENNQTLPLIIIGDLNIHLKSSKGNGLVNFMLSNDLENCVRGYTRIVSNYYKKKAKFCTTKSLIDVVIHTKNIINKIQNIPCPFSDHNFIAVELKVEASP